MDNGTKRALEDMNRKIDLILEMLGSQVEVETYNRNTKTTVIVKLENISNGITEIKSEITNVKKDQKEDHERLVKVEESAKSMHKRLDTCEKYCKQRLRDEPNE